METKTQHIDDLYKAFSHKLRQFIRKRVRDEATTDDILQDVFLKIHDHVDTLRDREKIESWIFQITRNAVTDHFRSQKPDQSEPQEALAHVEDEDQDAHRRLAAGLGEMIDQLPAPDGEALRLTEIEGLTQKKLAERLGISLPAAKSRVQRARARLRDILMQCCHFEFDRYGTVIDYHPISCCCCHQDSTSS